MKIIFVILLLLFLPLLLIPVYTQESTTEIPVWVKGVANFWIEGNIDDGEFGEALTFLIEQKIIKIDSAPVSEPIQEVLSNEEKRIFQLELNQKDDRINFLEKELKDTGLDNSHLLNSIVEKEGTIMILRQSLEQVKDDFQKYKEDYPLKVGAIGGQLVNVETVIALEELIKARELTIQELEEEIRELKNK